MYKTESVFPPRYSVLLMTAFGLGVAELRASFPDLPTDQMGSQVSLLKECEENWNHLHQFYDNVKIVAIRRESADQPQISQLHAGNRKAIEFVYRGRNGGFLRLDRTELDPDQESTRRGTTVWLVRPREFLLAERDGPDEKFFLKQQSRQDDGYEWAPYFNFAVSQQRVVFQRADDATLHTVEIATANENGERLAIATVKVAFEDGIVGVGNFVFFRDRSWAIKEATWGAPKLVAKDDRILRCQCQYDGSCDGIPLIKEVVTWQESGPERVKTKIESLEVQRLEIGPVALEEFSVETLGFSLGEERPAWLRPLLFCSAGGLLLLLCAAVRLRQVRRTRTSD